MPTFDRRKIITALLATPLVSAMPVPVMAEAMFAKEGRGMKHTQTSALDLAFLDYGPGDGYPVILLHGFPYDAHAYAEAAGRIAAAGRRCIVPFLRGFGPTRFLRADTFRSGQQAALGSDLREMMDALGLRTAVLAGYDWGGRAACVVAALWPERVSGIVTCGTAYNLQSLATAAKPVDADAERRHWYWYFLNSARGENALAGDRGLLCRKLWKDFSPTWTFDDATYARTAAAFDNPDFVAVVLHSYRVRIGAVAGDPALDPLERLLDRQPVIRVPTIALAGADDGVDPPAPPWQVRPHFTDLRRMTTLPGVGHNLPQEAPAAFADAVLQLGG